jgi:DNA-binding FadR family transcriptional regulator
LVNFMPTAPASRTREIAMRILADSGRAGLEPGARLPTERQLAASLAVTRAAVRHALAALEADGLISREVGRGTFLREAAAGALAAARGAAADGAGERRDGGHGPGGLVAGPPERERPAAPDFAPADVMTIRRLLEPQALPLVAAWATARDFAEMERCLAGGDQASGYEEFETWDLSLHRCIIAAAHSPLLVALYGVVESARHGQVWGDLKRRSATTQRREVYQADHHAIVAALRARDTGTAVEAMRVHLSRVAGDLLGEAH